MEQHLILVYYIGTGLIPDGDVDQFIREIMTKIQSSSPLVAEMIVIPTRDVDSRIECINPKYITEPELIREHRLKMDELREHLNINVPKKKEDENGESITG